MFGIEQWYSASSGELEKIHSNIKNLAEEGLE